MHFGQIWTNCIYNKLSETLQNFVQKICKKMLDNCYMYPKSIFPLLFVVQTSIYGWLKPFIERILLESANFLLFLL
jgi:hypothetical protein